MKPAQLVYLSTKNGLLSRTIKAVTIRQAVLM